MNVKCSSVILLLQKNKKTLQKGHSELSISLQLHCTHRVWTKTISWPVPEETTTESKMLALFSFSEILYGFVWERGFTLRTELCNKLIFHLLLLNPFNLFFFLWILFDFVQQSSCQDRKPTIFWSFRSQVRLSNSAGKIENIISTQRYSQ